MNDLRLNEACVKIKKIARRLQELEAEAKAGKTLHLFIALSDIEQAARNGQWRLNELEYGSNFVPPEEQMGN